MNTCTQQAAFHTRLWLLGPTGADKAHEPDDDKNDDDDPEEIDQSTSRMEQEPKYKQDHCNNDE
jgi:hypothetical protein